ncbi:SIR2 family NAD-dependent protein deacylase [Orrella sp. 11846]|uniref:SIR2 family NAD-dependent protein deacylase n=1 Tax=Orrella sp. 11846 TaxID=3409913 RepID=UPI003B5C9BEF
MSFDFDPLMLKRLAQAKSVVVFTGAGVSQESGIPTFRDALTGLWKNFDPNELATLEAFDRQPEIVWGWYEFRRAQLLQCAPNPAHLAIAQLQALQPNVHVVTQNVDDLHERAGSSDVIHLHGSIFQTRCRNCHAPFEYTQTATSVIDAHRASPPPSCPECGGPIRPGVVWFGEMLPEHEWSRAVEVIEQCDVLLSVGTSSVVYPAAELPFTASENGACVIQINPQTTSLDVVADYNLHGKAGEVLTALVSSI